MTHWSVETCSKQGSSIEGPEEYVRYNNATHNISSTVTSTYCKTAYETQPFGGLKQTLSKKQQDLDSVLAISTVESAMEIDWPKVKMLLYVCRSGVINKRQILHSILSGHKVSCLKQFFLICQVMPVWGKVSCLHSVNFNRNSSRLWVEFTVWSV